MTHYTVHKRDSVLDQRHDENEEREPEDVIRERRAFRFAIGVLALFVGLGLVCNAVSEILDRLME
jgi:Na+/H+ antiporter NhaD/arsenite permease-like protein